MNTPALSASLTTVPEDTIPYCAEASGPAQINLPATFTVADYGGLLLCYVVRRPEGRDTLVTFWRSHDHYRSNSPKCFLVLGLSPADHGWISSIVEKRESALKQIRAALCRPAVIISVLATSAAIYSNIASLRSAITDLFVAPTSQLADEPKRMVRSDRPVTIQGRILNFGEVTANFKVTNIDVSPSGAGLDPPALPTPMPKLEAGKEGAVSLKMIPRRKGEFTVTVRGVASNDWFGQSDILWPIAVSIWEPIDGGKSELWRVVDEGKGCAVKCRLQIGRASDAGFFCGIKLEGERDVDFEPTVQCPSRPNPTVTSLPAAGENDARIIQIEWDSPGKTEAFSVCEFYVRLKSATPKTSEEWSRIARKVTPDATLKQP